MIEVLAAINATMTEIGFLRITALMTVLILLGAQQDR